MRIASNDIKRRGFLPNHPSSEFGASVVELNDDSIVIDNPNHPNDGEPVAERHLDEIEWSHETPG